MSGVSKPYPVFSKPSTTHIDLVGTLRTCSPEETLARIRPYLGNFGITRVARVTGLDCIGIPVTTCVRPASKNLSVSQGKGYTQELADVSAIMEAVELFHAETPPPPELTGPWSQICNKVEAIPAQSFVPGWYPWSKDDDPNLNWIPSQDLVSGRTFYIPQQLVDFDQTRFTKDHMRLFISTNGLASGNHREEAICHGLCEVIERHSAGQWFALDSLEQQRTEVDLRTVDGPPRALIDLFEAARIRVRVWDATGELGVPTFVCYIRGIREFRNLTTFGGMGAHPSRRIAISRALTEAAQSRLTVISGTRDDTFPSEYKRQYLDVGRDLPPTGSHAKCYRDCASIDVPASFSGILDELVERTVHAGFDRVLVVDQTKEDLGIPVTHIFVPGMEVPPH